MRNFSEKPKDGDRWPDINVHCRIILKLVLNKSIGRFWTLEMWRADVNKIMNLMFIGPCIILIVE